LPLNIHFAIGNFIRDAMNGGPIIIKGDGTPYRSYLYTADLTIWLWTILLRGKACHPYNVGSEKDMQIAQVANCVAQQLNPTIEVKVLGTQIHEKAPERYTPSVARSRQELGLEAWIPIQDGIARTIQFHRGEK